MPLVGPIPKGRGNFPFSKEERVVKESLRGREQGLWLGCKANKKITETQAHTFKVNGWRTEYLVTSVKGSWPVICILYRVDCRKKWIGKCESLEGLETSLYDTTVTQICQTLIKTHKVHSTKRKSWHELWTLGYGGVPVCLHWSQYVYHFSALHLKVDIRSPSLSLNLTLILFFFIITLIWKTFKAGAPISCPEFPIALGSHTSASSYFCFVLFLSQKSQIKYLCVLCAWEMMPYSIITKL